MSSLNDFRAREEQLRKLDQELNDKKNAVVRRAEELVVRTIHAKQQRC